MTISFVGSARDETGAGGRRRATVVYGEQGSAAIEPSAPAARDGVIEPIARGIGQLMVALSDLEGASADTAHLRVGRLDVEYQGLQRPNGSIRLSWLDHPESEPSPIRLLAEAGARAPGESAATEAPDTEDAGRWELALSAARAGAHSEALAHFEREADDAASAGAHGRAALAYRSASGQADRLGRSDAANRLLRLAGKHYLCLAEGRETPVRALRQAYEMAAKCFLQAGNLVLADTSIKRALSLDDVLG